MTELASDTIVAIREDYRAGRPIAEIEAAYGVSRGTLYYWLHGGPDEAVERRLPPIPLRYTYRAVRASPRKARRAQIVERVWRAAEKQVRAIEQRMASPERVADERERDARLLAVLVKTLRELSAMDAAAAAPRADAKNAKNADDANEPSSYDMEEFRNALARRLESIVAEPAEAGADGTEVS